MPETEPHIDSEAERPAGCVQMRAKGNLVGCPRCGAWFHPTRRWHKWCSDECRFKARHEATRTSLPLPFPAHDSATQCDRLLDALRRGPVTNGQMLYDLRIGNHTGRISDLRKQGHRIEKISQDHHTGLTVYELLAPQQGELGDVS